MDDVTVRPLQPSDLSETLDMWVAAWQVAYPDIDFAARRNWITERIGGTDASVAIAHERIIGLLVFDPSSGYLDQIVVAPEYQGRGIAFRLLTQALSGAQTVMLHVNQDNRRAIRFYEKHGFVVTREDVNPRSGAPTYEMLWER
jgi:putative acetyltransferase